MTIFNSISRNIKNVFVGSHKGEDVSYEWSHPHDSMPIATNSNRYAPPEKLAELAAIERNPRPEEQMADWFNVDKEDGLDYEGPVDQTIHEKMYEIATSKYNPFSVGGSGNIHDFDKTEEEEPLDLAPSEYEPS